MSDYAWIGVLLSAAISTLAVGAYMVMALPYFDDAPYLTDLRKNTRRALFIGAALFAVFFIIYLLGALFMDRDTSGPLLLLGAFIIGLPISLLVGTETWDRRNPRGMNQLPGIHAVAVATGIGLVEIVGFLVGFLVLLQLAQ